MRYIVHGYAPRVEKVYYQYADISQFGIPKKVNFDPFYQQAGVNTDTYRIDNTPIAPYSAQLGSQAVLPAQTTATQPAQQPAQAPSSGGGGDSQLQQLQKIKNSGGLNPTQQSLYDQLTASAQTGNNATMQAIQNKLNLVREQANQQITNAGDTRDYLVNFINQRYPELARRVEEQRTNALNDLGTQKTGLQNLYDKANAQARRRSESVALQNRMTARAGNRLGSSFYDQMVQDNQENLGRTLGESDLERIAKMAGIDTQTNVANQGFNNTLNDLESQKSQATYSAIDDYKKALQEADYLSKAGLADFGSEQAAATQNLQSRLDAIAQWAQGMAQQQQVLNAQYGSGGGFDTTLQGLGTQNQNFLTQNAQTPAGNNLSNISLNTLGTPQTTSTNQAGQIALAGNQKIPTLQDLLGMAGLPYAR